VTRLSLAELVLAELVLAELVLAELVLAELVLAELVLAELLLADVGRGPDPEDGLAAADAPVGAVPGPVTAAVSVYHLQRSYRGTVQVDGQIQVRRGLGDLHDLDQRAVDQRDLLTRRRRAGVQHVVGHGVQKLPGPAQRHAGDDQFGLAAAGEPDRVSPGRVHPVALHSLHGPAVLGD
jgi:hypothetical protein